VWRRKKEKKNNMFAVIKSGGRQYKVSVGDKLEVNRLPVEDGAQVKFEEVLLISDEDTSMIGTPFLDNAMVLATAVKHTRGKKLIVFRYKAKKRFRHKRGHRQELTVLTIDDIVADGKSLITGEAPKAEEKAAPAEDAMVPPPTTTETETPVTPTTEPATEERRIRRRRSAEGVETTESRIEEE
jgi:large subunit ribosomal protein L21